MLQDQKSILYFEPPSSIPLRFAKVVFIFIFLVILVGIIYFFINFLSDLPIITDISSLIESNIDYIAIFLLIIIFLYSLLGFLPQSYIVFIQSNRDLILEKKAGKRITRKVFPLNQIKSITFLEIVPIRKKIVGRPDPPPKKTYKAVISFTDESKPFTIVTAYKGGIVQQIIKNAEKFNLPTEVKTEKKYQFL